MKKFSKKLIWYRLIVNIFISFIISSFAFSSFLPEEDVSIDAETLNLALIVTAIAFVLSYIILGIYQVLYYKTSGYELKENEIICVRGVLFKKRSIVEYKKIHAVNSKQNIIEKIFSLSTLQVDSGSANTAHTAEVQIIEDEDVVQKLMQIIKGKQNNEEVSISENNAESNEVNNEIESIYNFDSKRKLIYTALQVFWVIIGGAFSLVTALFIMVILVIIKEMDLPLLLIILLGSLLVLLLISIIGFIFGLIGTLISYYDFKLIRNKNDIEISYGLITKIHNTFKYNKIKAIRIKESIVQRIFGFVSVSVEVIGYTVQSNDENKSISTGILIPLCKKSEVNTILEKILPNYIPLERENKAKEFIPFISYHVLFSFALLILVQICLVIFLVYYNFINEFMIASVIIWIVYALYMFVILIERKFAHINSGFTVDSDKLCIFRGSIVKETVVIRKNNIIGIDAKTTHFRSKKNIYTYKLHFKSNAETNTITVLNVDKNEGDKMYELIRY